MTEPSKSSYETPFVLSDSPLSENDAAYFHFDEFAITLARLIAAKSTRTPLAIGISGAWGSGKTTLLSRIQRQLDQTICLLDKQKPARMEFVNPDEVPEQLFRVCRTVWFNAWKYADEDELLVALYRVIVQTMAQDGMVNKVIGKLLDATYPRRDVVNTVLSWFSLKAGAVEVGLNTGEPQPTALAEKTALLDLFDEAFDRLMAAWVHHKLDTERINPQNGVLVVFIDDLDHCLPAKTFQVLEAIKLFLDRPGCIFVLGADVEVICQAVESYYQNAHITGQNAVDHLDKIIQLRFNLPPVVAETMQKFLKDQQVGEEMLSQWQTLIAAAEVNPRRAKAVLNDIELQWRMLANSGLAQGVQRADFVRWSALLRTAPANFRQCLFDIDNVNIRLKFVQDALRWGSGEQDKVLQRTFQKYKKEGRRLRRVLREIRTFGAEFDANTLEAFIHLTAPPPRPAPTREAPGQKTEAAEPEAAPERGVSRVSKPGLEEMRPDRRTYAGIEFVRVPVGPFLMGSKEGNSLAFDNEKPQHTVEMPSEFWIARYPVTNAQFTSFTQATSYRTTAEEQGSAYAYDGKEWKDTEGANWQHPRGPKSSLKGKENHPVMSVSWLDAMEFCRWLNETYQSELPEGWQLRLPTEAEWEKAARGEYGNEWPWGDQEPDEKLCNFDMNIKDTTPVGKYSPQGDSPYGCADMAGNVWEWTHSLYKEYPYNAEDGREDEEDPGIRVLRGGSFNYDRRFVRCALRNRDSPVDRNATIGFRVVASPIFECKGRTCRKCNTL